MRFRAVGIIAALCVAVPAFKAARSNARAHASAGATRSLATAVLASGCYWTSENVFEHVHGVVDVVAGFATGDAASTVGPGGVPQTSPAEAVRITYDPARVTYAQLLRVFFGVAHDPTQVNRQGPDVGPSYRSLILYADSAQRSTATAYIAQLSRAGTYAKPIATAVVKLGGFTPADPDQQDFAARHPDSRYIVVNDRPKLERLRRELPSLWQERLAAR